MESISYCELKELADSVNKQIYQAIIEKGKEKIPFAPEKLFESPENIDGLDIANNILILGINPSSSDLEGKSRKNNCFLEYIPEKEESKIACDLKHQGFTYPLYFKKNYELFKDYGYNMLWQTGQYLDRYKDKLSLESYKFLMEKTHVRNRNFLIFSDLIFFKMTDSNVINEPLDMCSDDIFNLFQIQLGYYKPQLVLIANSKASKLIYYHMTETSDGKITASELYCDGIPIVFAPMTTGRRGIDDFSLVRLKRDIGNLLRKKSL